MEVSFQGIGEWSATFMGGGLTEGQVVKMSGNGTVTACSAEDDFCGVVQRGGPEACAVQLGGMVTVDYSGTAPAVGFAMLSADGAGGVKTAAENSGRSLLVTAVDTTEKTATIKL